MISYDSIDEDIGCIVPISDLNKFIKRIKIYFNIYLNGVVKTGINIGEDDVCWVELVDILLSKTWGNGK